MFNERWSFIEQYTEKGIDSREKLRQFFDKQEKEIKELVNASKVRYYQETKTPYARCKQCGFVGRVDEFRGSTSVYHDLACPEPTCGTTNIDTSGILAVEPDYGFGSDNFLSAGKT